MADWIEPPAKAPSFSLKSTDGTTVKLSDLKGKPVVLYFYPKDDTPGCTKEACAFRDRSGRVPQVHVDLLELSADGQWLYFAPLLGPMLRRVPTAVLVDATLGDDEVAASVEDVIAIPPLAGLARDADDNLYICAFSQDAILRLRPGGKSLETLICDPRISFPNEGCVGPDGYFYFPGSQIHRSARFGDGTSKVQLPFEVMKIRI